LAGKIGLKGNQDMSAGFWTKKRATGLTIRRMILWAVLSIPAIGMTSGVLQGSADVHALLHPTGEFGIRLMLLALLVGPLIDIFGPNTFLRLWLKIRRNLGVAAFAYAVLHLVFYAIDKSALSAILAEVVEAGIWTGWVSFFAMMAAAVISADWAVRKLGPLWKRIQMGVYIAYILGIVHWWLIHGEIGPGMVHLAPLLIVWALRIPLQNRRRRKSEALAAYA